MSSPLGSVMEMGEDLTEEEVSFMELGPEVEEPKEPSQRKQPKEQELSPEEMEFMELENPYQEVPEKEATGYWRSMLNSVPRGLIEGVIRFGRVMGPLPDTEDYKYEPEKLSAQLDEWFPVDEDAGIPQVIKGAGQMLPTALATPIPGAGAAPSLLNTTTRAVASSAAGKIAEDQKLPGWAQTIAEIAPWMAPNLAAVNTEAVSIGGILSKLEEKAPNWAKKLVSQKGPESLKKTFREMVDGASSRKEILDFAKAAGMKEAEITPLLQGETKQRWLSKLSSKGEKLEGKMVDTKNAIGKVYDSIAELPGSHTKLNQSQNTRFIKSLQDKFEKMPASVRNTVQEDFQQLIDGPIDGNKIMKFFKDVNHELGPKTKQLSNLKEPIKKMLMEVDPAMGQMFDMTNKLYGKFSGIAQRLKPGLAEGLWSEGKAQGVLYGVMAGDMGILTKIAKVSGAKKVAEFMLTSPRWQNLSGKMVSALNEGKFVVAEHIKQQMIDDIKEVDPRVAAALQELNIKATLGDEE